MRYREGQEIPDNIEPHIGDASMAFTAVLGLFIGIVLTILARKGRIMWLTVWGAVLVIISIIYLAYLGLK
ncbi:MAG: hypothetical protein P8Y24_04525 [Gammaproteobacteria bacterium]|jgi:hypothetical protein